MKRFRIGDREIGVGCPVYFIADIGANHDGDLERAEKLIRLAKAAGADAAKFQHFHANRIVSDYGFRKMDDRLSHQAKWRSSVFDVYAKASLPDEWTPKLKAICDATGIEYLSSPYDFEATEALDPFVHAFKVGSGDIDWLEAIEFIAKKQKPVLLATGAADIGEVQAAVDLVRRYSDEVVLMQCNTNYTGDPANFDHIHLNVLTTFKTMYPDIIVGLSDHTPGHSTVLGAIAMGAAVVEKHFTDDNGREGPDHPFAMNPQTFREMVDRARELERALGSARKFVAENELETRWVQRRCLRAAVDISLGQRIERSMLDVLRPATREGVAPSQIERVVGCRAAEAIPSGEAIAWTMLRR